MKKLLYRFIVIMGCLIIYSCNRQPLNFLDAENQNKVIAIQPLDGFDTGQLNFLRDEISSFYKRKVVIFKPLLIPGSFSLPYDSRYSADSIIGFLSRLTGDTIVEVVGLTHEDIYTIPETQKKAITFKDIFGLGYLPGNSCVISDYRLLHSNEPEKSNQRLRTIIIHEMGHNLGLQHCSDNKCIMSDQNGKISILDNSGNDYCNNCKRKLK